MKRLTRGDDKQKRRGQERRKRREEKNTRIERAMEENKIKKRGRGEGQTLEDREENSEKREEKIIKSLKIPLLM